MVGCISHQLSAVKLVQCKSLLQVDQGHSFLCIFSMTFGIEKAICSSPNWKTKFLRTSLLQHCMHLKCNCKFRDTIVLCSPVTSTLIPLTILSEVCSVHLSAGGGGYKGKPWHVVGLDFPDIKELLLIR